MRHRSLWVATLLSLALHAYVGSRLLPAIAPGPLALALALAYLFLSAVLMPAPLMVRLASLPERAADVLAWTGYLAMGVFSSLFVLTVLRDLALALAAVVALAVPVPLEALSRLSAPGVLLLTALISGVGVFNARRTASVVNVELPIAGLPPALAGFCIVQISDLHVGPTIKRGYVAAIVERVNGLAPDVVAITGDLIDGAVHRVRGHVEPLRELRSTHGTYCVTGNHEYYHGIGPWLEEWRRLGLRVLLNEGRTLEHRGERVLLGGVTDYGAHRFDATHRSDPAAAVRAGADVAVKVLLAHQPRSAPAAAEAGFDVQLSGHTHGGQFWPWPFLVPMQQPFVSGLKRLGTLQVYTSRGTGYWGPPIRFGAPSEITRLTLVPG